MKIFKDGKKTVAEGKEIRVVATELESGGAIADVFARGARGWTLVAGSDRTTVAPHPRTEAGGPSLRCKNRSLMFPQRLAGAEARAGRAKITLIGETAGNSAAQTLSFSDNDLFVNVAVTIKLEKPARVSSSGSYYAFLPGGRLYSQYEPLDYIWIPHLRRDSEHVIGDQIFRSPAVIYVKGEIGAALIPDLDILKANRRLPTALDAKVENPGLDAPLFGFGFRQYEVDGHVFFKAKAPGDSPISGELKYGFDILANAREKERRITRMVNEHLWRRYGAPLFKGTDPQALPYEECARRVFGFAFERGNIWREVETGGAPAGGTMALTFAGPAPASFMKDAQLKASLSAQRFIPKIHSIATEKLMNKPAINDLGELLVHHAPMSAPPQVMYQSWFCNMRTAHGAYSWAERLGDEEMKKKALAMKELALAAPVERGFMRSACFCPEDAPPFWFQGTKAFQAVREYHLPDNAWTGWWMLRWHEELEPDKRLMDRSAALGAAFVEAQLSSGAIPGWVRVRKSGPIACSTLRESAQTAAPGMFLARLGAATGDKRFSRAARRAADFLINEIFPKNKWWDFETFFSCSKKDFGMRDAGTGVECMNNLCVFWTAELMRELAAAGAGAKYLEHGLMAVDTLTMWQQVWDAPYVSINTFGGFGVMNTDAEWNDARQSMFAECLAGYYELTGNGEYMERAVAALRSSFTTMLAPEHRRVAPGNMGMYIPKDEGAVYENYAHMGFDRRAPGYIMFDWGGGGACSAAANMTRKYGDAFIDASASAGFGLDLCSVTSVSVRAGRLDIGLESPDAASRPLRVRVANLEPGDWKLVVNGQPQGVFSAERLDAGTTVSPERKSAARARGGKR
ncbi:MAG TPA: hypothetical protein PLK80_06005 [bacterium]|nr:hypothetical protein [bacterium]